MHGKNILITGASSGMGEAIAKHMHNLGATVVLVARSEDKLRAMAEEMKDRVFICPTDLTQSDAIAQAFAFCKQNSLMLNGVVHSAGITLSCPLRANSMEQNEKMFRINVESLAEICRMASSKRYVSEGASIVALSSSASLCGDKGIAMYSASKAAVNILVKSAALELVHRKIRINAIAPAMVRTPMYYETIREIPAMEEIVNGNQPLGVIEPDSIADLAEFLLTDKSRFITGTTIVVGGGHVF